MEFEPRIDECGPSKCGQYDEVDLDVEADMISWRASTSLIVNEDVFAIISPGSPFEESADMDTLRACVTEHEADPLKIDVLCAVLP